MSMDWIDLAQNRERWRAVVNAVMNLRVSLNAGNFLITWEPVSFSRTLPHGVTTTTTTAAAAATTTTTTTTTALDSGRWV